MPLAIFISYRRSDSAGTTGRLYDTLTAHFGEEHVFMDVDSIEPGDEFAAVLTETLLQCQAVVVVIAPTWATVRTENDTRRLDNPEDYVRLEIEQAISSGCSIFPVLVDGAAMPAADELPPSLQPLLSRQAIELTSSRYKYDAGRLVSALEKAVDVSVSPPEGNRARPGSRGGRPQPGRDRARLQKRRYRWISLGSLILVVALFVPWTLQQVRAPEWNKLPPAPIEFEGAGTVAFEGRVWVAGGVSAAEGRPLLDTVRVFDPMTGTWAEGPPLPRPVAFAPLVVASDQLYLLGGQVADGAVDSVLRLDADTGTWVEEAPLPEPREAGAAAWDGSRIVYAGGVGRDHGVSDDVYALENGRWRPIGELQIAREKIVAASDEFGTVWLLGGRDRKSGVPAFGTVDVVQVDHVSAGTSIYPVHSAAAAWIPGAGVCVIGGDTGAGLTGDVQCLSGYDDFAPLPEGRAGLGAAVVDLHLYVVGGYGAGFHGTSALEAFHLGTV